MVVKFEDMDEKLKHLEMIQNIVNRMASSSFLLKGWTVIFVAAVLGFSLKDSNAPYLWIAAIPACSFWALDGFYLRREKLFRKLYEKVRKSKSDDLDFSMDTSLVEHEVKNWFCVCRSKTIWLFHLPILAVIILVVCLKLFCIN